MKVIDKKITRALEDHAELKFPRFYDDFELLPELDLLDGDLYGELLSISKQGAIKCEYLKKYQEDYEKIKQEAERKKFTKVLEYLESIKLLIDLCVECETPEKHEKLIA